MFRIWLGLLYLLIKILAMLFFKEFAINLNCFLFVHIFEFTNSRNMLNINAISMKLCITEYQSE